jgi:hypothetical protein
VRNDAEIPDELRIHGSSWAAVPRRRNTLRASATPFKLSSVPQIAAPGQRSPALEDREPAAFHAASEPLGGISCTLSASMLGAAATMKRMGRRVVLVMLIVSVRAGPEIFGQNAQPNVDRESSDDLAPIQQDSKWGYADRAGRVVIKPQFSRAGRFSEGLALVWTGGAPLTDPEATSFVRMGYIDATGRWVIHSRFQYYFFDDFSEGLVPFRKQFGKWGYMDRTGKIAIRPQFDWAGSFSAGIAPALLDGRCAHLDKTGRVTDQSQAILPPQKNEEDGHGTYRFKPHVPPCC